MKFLKKLVEILLVAIISIIISLSIFLLSSLNNIDMFSQNPFYKFNIIYTILFTIKIAIFIFIFEVFLYLKNFENNRKKEIMNKIPGAVIIYDFNGKILYVNDFINDMFGYKKEDVINNNILMFLADKDKQRAFSELKVDVENKIIKNPTASWTLITADKMEVDVIINFSFYNKKSVIAICMDNTKILEAKKSHSQQIQFFWSLLNDIPLPMSYRDVDGVYKFVNDAFQKYMNIKETDILGKKTNYVVDKDEYNRFEEKRKLALKTGKEIIFNDISTINNKKRILHLEIIPRINENKIKGTFVTFKDITNEKIKEIALKKEIALNKVINEISEIMISSNSNQLHDNINIILEKIRIILNVDRVYIIAENINNQFYIKFESINKNINPYINHIFNTNEEEYNFMKKIIRNNLKIASSRIKMSQLYQLNHIKKLNAKSVAEVGVFIDNNIYGIVGAISENKIVKFTVKEVDFLKSVSNSIFGTAVRLKQMDDLKLSEETLNTIIDNKKFGIIIISENNNIYYINDKAYLLLGENKLEKINLSEYVSVEYTDIVNKAFKENKNFDLNLKLKSNNLVEIYGSEINFDANKAYLIIMIDINKYI